MAASARTSLTWRAGVGALIALTVLSGHAQQRATLLRVAETGVLRVCTTGDYRPFTIRHADGAYEGIDIEMARDLARSLDAQAEFVPTSWPKLMDDFLGGKCDVAMGGVSITLDRQRRADFSTPYLVDGKSAIARCENVARFANLASIDQPGVRAIVNPGGTNERFARANLHRAELRIYPDNTTIFEELVKGAADVMITDASETLVQHKLHPELCAIHPEQPFTFAEKAYLLPQADPDFKDYVDQWLHQAQRNGTLQGRLDAWLK
jgi:cyclohexadienyl dehydratase